jgi:hypothetical protein
LLIRKTDDAVSAGFQVFFAVSVGLLLELMNFAVYFNDECRLMAVEIDDKGFDDLLPAEMDASQTVCPQARPESGFGWGHGVAKLFGEGVFTGGDILTADGEFYGLGFGFHWAFPWVIILMIVQVKRKKRVEMAGLICMVRWAKAVTYPWPFPGREGEWPVGWLDVRGMCGQRWFGREGNVRRGDWM